MPYVRRGSDGAVLAVQAERSEECPQFLSPDDADLAVFLEQAGIGSGARDPRNMLAQSDLEMSRVLEDLIDLLIRKGVLSPGELPTTARDKLSRRRELRGHLKWLADIVGGDKIG
ncbi:hypothetical protein KAJ83_11385 [Marivibrio halodurans]|uniref:Tryptophan synthase subunit beta like protein n=1 Tax=Marivibrio halodurans TaxID=2039722 RepID=A0A8J7V4E4_9PROT|nr:hypothetical protein [Marivibrio halodurans]MBP5857614.1 hypothetical protein [Marivibrio halodurans]